jgi:hypothetical protein
MLLDTSNFRGSTPRRLLSRISSSNTFCLGGGQGILLLNLSNMLLLLKLRRLLLQINQSIPTVGTPLARRVDIKNKLLRIDRIIQIIPIIPIIPINQIILRTGAAGERKLDIGSALVAIIIIALEAVWYKKIVFDRTVDIANALKVAFTHGRLDEIFAAGGLMDEFIDLRKHFVDTLL